MDLAQEYKARVETSEQERSGAAGHISLRENSKRQALQPVQNSSTHCLQTEISVPQHAGKHPLNLLR